jgi:hypothetical protein
MVTGAKQHDCTVSCTYRSEPILLSPSAEYKVMEFQEHGPSGLHKFCCVPSHCGVEHATARAFTRTQTSLTAMVVRWKDEHNLATCQSIWVESGKT